MIFRILEDQYAQKSRESKEQARAADQRFMQLALSLGGTDEGPPGPRGEGGFYAGYFRDLDGNKLNVFCMT